MDVFNHSIRIKSRFYIFNAVFLEKTKFVTDGKIIMDKDLYNFAGIFTNDKMVGYYNNGEYKIYYSGETHNLSLFPKKLSRQYYNMDLYAKFEIRNILEDLERDNEFIFNIGSGRIAELIFKEIYKEDINSVQQVVNDFLEAKLIEF